jgi:Ca-activated chloride channel homolog
LRDRRPALISAGLAALLLVAGWVWRPSPVVPCTSILVASSNEKYATLVSLANQYSSLHQGPVGCAAVRIEKVASGDAERRLVAGWSGPDRPEVWSPASSTWVVLTRAQLGANQDLLPVTYSSIAYSPLVIGMPQPMAEALGWPNSQPSWRDLLSLSLDPSGWGRFGHADWGKFSLAQTNPNISTSGLHSLIAIYYAATGKSANLVASDVSGSQAVEFVREVEASAAHYSDTAENFLRTLKAADDEGSARALGYISAFTLEEQELRQYNRGQIGESQPAAPPRVQLEAIYPRDGTLVANHPFVVLNGIGSAKTGLARDFLAWLLLKDQQQAFANAGFRVQGTSTAPGGGILPDQPNAELQPPLPAILVQIQKSWQQLRKRARILIVVDATTPLVRDGLAKAIGQLAPDDEVGVWVVGPDEKQQPYKALRPISAVGNDPSQLEAAVRAIPREQGNPPLLGGIEAAFNYLMANSDPHRVDAVLVVAGGKNDSSRGPDLVTLLREVRFDPQGSATRVFGVSTSADDDATMSRVAEASGGVAYTHNVVAVSTALQRLVADF